ncbi:recombinase family protein [Cytobacillus praedii]|uniref:Recombinase family protein n=1 Tax=Cytobacillus praedii TaxID=1742358 RepID=A0A4R1APG8_9BACI|nr:recombinase family protein [Cytobacillus praedii]TCJ01791.1 recombinase family protein [Cytobacillus praedii]
MIILRGNETLTSDELFSLIGKINGIIYARVSTADQAKKGYSLESQIDKCNERALTKYKFKDDEIIALVEEGAMGDDPNRPALNYAMYLLEKGLGKKFFILHPDRLTRDNTLQGVVSRRIWNMGVDIEFIEFEVDPNDPESMLMYNIQGSIAQYNKAKIAANSKRGRIQKAKKGEIPNFKRMYGYSYNKETDTLNINEEEKEVINEMIDLLLNKNTSCNQIAKELSKRGIPAPNGKVWYQTTVTRILRNESYKGVFYHGQTKVVQKSGEKQQVPMPREEWIPINIPVIIDSLTFEKIQLAIDEFSKGKGRKSKNYLLKGIAKCGRCGGAAGSGITSKVKNGVYKYYACRKKASKGYEVGTGENVHVCKGKNWRVDIVDQIVWDWLADTLSNPKALIEELVSELGDSDKLKNLENKAKTIQDKIKEVKKEETNYIMLFGKGKIDESQFDMLTKPLKENLNYLNDELRVINTQIANLSKSVDEVLMIENYLKKFQESIASDNLDISEKREIVKMFIREVILNEDDTIIINTKWDSDGTDPDSNRHKKQVNGQAYGRQTA